MQNNPIREMVEAIERVAVDYPDEKVLMISSTWTLLQDIVDASETEIETLNTHSEEDYRTLIQDVHTSEYLARETYVVNPLEYEYSQRDLYAGTTVDDPDKALRFMRHLADMIDYLYDMYGGQCDLQIKWMEEEPDDLSEYYYEWTVTPDQDVYTVDEHGMCIYEDVTHTFHVKDDVVTLPLQIEE